MRSRPAMMATLVLALVVQTFALLAISIAPASAAPLGLQAGDLVISDSGHDRVIVVPADGGPDRVLTTDVDSPSGVVVTPAGDVIVADTGNDQILKVRADGTGTDVLRTGTWGVTSVALDRQGRVLFTGTSWGGIGRVTQAGANLSTLADSPSIWPWGVGVAADGDIVFGDRGTGVKRMEADGTNIRAVAGFPPASTALGFNYTGVAVGPGDTVYATETNDDAVFVGDGSADAVARGDLDEPAAVVLEVDGTQVVADSFNDRVVAISPDGSSQTVVATDSPLLHPTGVAVVPVPPAEVGDVFVGTTSGDVVRTSADGSGAVTLAAGLGTITDVAVDSAGNAFAATTDGEVHEISADATTVQLLLDRTSPVTSVAVGPDEALYFTEDPGGVRRWTQADGVHDLAPDGGYHLVGVAVDDNGMPYATSTGSVGRVQGGALDALAPDFVDSVGVAWDPAGRLLVAHRSQDQLVAVDPVTGAAEVVALIDEIRGVTVAGDGRLVAISDAGDVVRVDADGSNPTVLTSVTGVRGVDTYVPRPSFTAGGPVTATGNVGTAYSSYDFDADVNGGGTVAFTLYSGSLPPGLSLDPSTGVLSGTPTAAGSYSFRVRAANSGRGVVTAQQTIEVGKRLQTISFTSTAPSPGSPDGTYTPTATASSGLTVTFSVTTPSVCSISGGEVTFLAGGTCTVQAEQAGDAAYEPVTETQDVHVDRLTQANPVYNETLPTGVRVGDTYTPTATAPGPGTPVEFETTFVFPESFDPRCEYDSSTGKITFTHAGTCRLRAFRPTNDRYWSAQSLYRDITVLPALLGFEAPTTPRAGEFEVLTSNDPNASYDIDYATTGTDALGDYVCTVGWHGGLSAYVAYFNSPGTCALWAYSNDDYTPSSDVVTFTILKAAQTITFTSTAPAAAQVGDTYDPAATSTATGPVSFAIAAGSAAVCSIAGGTVTFEQVGDCVVRAEHPGDDDFDAGSETQTITVGQRPQSISFTSTLPTGTDAVVGEEYTPAATATSGLTVAFSVAPASSGVCSISGGVVSFEHVGDCVVRANQAGNADYAAATQETQTITVGQASQAIVFNSVPTDGVVGQTYDPASAASASSGGAVSYSLAPASAGVCSMSGGIVSYDHVGDCVIRLDQAGNADYLPAPQREMTVTVGRAAQSLVFTSSPADTTVGATYTPVATGGASGNAVVLSIAPGSAGVCSMSAGTVSFDSPGDCVVRANQAGNTDYDAAPQVEQTIRVGLRPSGISFISAPPSARVGQTYVPVTVTTPATGTVELSVAGPGGVCSIAGGTVTFLRAGSCEIRAVFLPAGTTYGSSSATQTVVVGRAGTETELELMRDTLVATVTSDEPGTPTGLVEFEVDGEVVGTAQLQEVEGERVAFLVHTVASTGDPHELTATYLGSDDHAGSADSVTRIDPTLEAEVTSRIERSPAGWYRTPVRITFTCTVGSAPLVGGCPTPLRLTENRRGLRPISVRADAEDGASAQVDLVVRIDRTDPVVKVRGAKPDRTYAHKQQLRCVVRDQLSGPDRCRVTQRVRGERVRFKAVGLDLAGNRTVVRGRYFLR